MSHWEDYDYFEDKFEAEQIVDDAIEQLTGLISKRIKDDIDETKKQNEKLSDKNAELIKENWELREQNDILKLDVKSIKEELEREDNKVPRAPYVPGDEAWYIGNEKHIIVKCPKCNGEGTVKTQTADYGEIKIACPKCKGQSTSGYYTAAPCHCYVARTFIALDAKNDSPKFTYDLVSNEQELDMYKRSKTLSTTHKDTIYKTKKEAEEAANKETEARKIEAEKLFNK